MSLSFNHCAALFFSVCPPGFEWLDNHGCIALIEEALTKADALAKCQSKNQLAHLMMPKTKFEQLKLQQFLAGNNFTDGSFFLGMSKVDKQWLWDDGSPVFTQCKLV